MPQEDLQVDYLADGHGPHTTQELWDIIRHHPKSPATITGFQRRLGYWIRLRRLERPKRVPRRDGAKGTEGLYPAGTILEILQLLDGKAPSAVGEEKPQKAKRRPTAKSKQIRLDVWVYPALGDRIESLMRDGHPVSELLLIGTRLLHEMPPDTRELLVTTLREANAVRDDRRQDMRWQYVCAFEMAAHLLERLSALAKQSGVDHDDLKWRGRFEFTVIDGKVKITAALVEDHAEGFKRIEV